ncbi:hypothetical protein NMY22_g7519 [Coprinellus aureogranulatus]|nr:hypothetical protein NMY22_g7519 [Coprinellus aureogranulatus]
MSSRSTRSRILKRHAPDPPHQPAVDKQMDAEAEESSGSGQQNAAMAVTGNGKQREVYFDFLDGLPAEILGEILSYLASVDLLHLARTTKRLRAFLMSRTAIVFWKRSRESDTDRPPCPDDMSEPAYAHMLFSDFCHKCLADDRDILVHLEARTQLCENCTLEEFKRWKELPEEVDPDLSELVPDTVQQLTDKEKKMDWHRSSAEYQRVARTRFHADTAMKKHREYTTIRRAKQKATWLEEQKLSYQEVEEHARKCRDYINNQRWKERDAIWEAKRRRADQIQQKLADLGYGDEFRDTGKYWAETRPDAVSSLLYEEQELTDEEWDGIRDEFVQWMLAVRNARQKHSKLEGMRRRVEVSLAQPYLAFALLQPEGTIIPTLAELALMESVAKTLNSFPLDQSLPDDAVDGVVAQLPELVQGWKTQLEESLFDLLRQTSAYADRDNVTKDVLFYVSTTFTCSHCVGVLTYPGIFAHSCFTFAITSSDLASILPGERLKKSSATSSSNHSQVLQDGVHSSLVRATFGYFPGPNFQPFVGLTHNSTYQVWRPATNLQFNEAMHHHTVALLNQLGMEETTTMSDFLQVNPYVEGTCQCFHAGRSTHDLAPRKASRWFQALPQCRRHRSRDYASSFKIVDEVELAGMLGYSPVNSQPPINRSRCFLCGATPRMNIEYHLMNAHGLSQADADAAGQLAPREFFYPVSTVVEISAGGLVSVSRKRSRFSR